MLVMTSPQTPLSVRLLCVDDNPYIREAIGFILSRASFEVTSAADGREALQIIASAAEPFQLLITDYDMPELNGLELVRALRAAANPLPVMVISGSLDDEAIAQFEALGVWRILPKPFMPQTIVESVEEYLDREPLQSALGGDGGF